MSRGSWHWVPPVLEELLENKEVRTLAREIGKSPELLYGVLNGQTKTARLSTVQSVKQKLSEMDEGHRAERLFRKREKSKG